MWGFSIWLFTGIRHSFGGATVSGASGWRRGLPPFPHDLTSGMTESRARTFSAPYYSKLLDQIPDGRDADFPLRRHDEY
jgi:hypothetical protein